MNEQKFLFTELPVEQKDLIQQYFESQNAVTDIIEAINILADNSAISALVEGLLNWHHIAEYTKHNLITCHGYTLKEIEQFEKQLVMKK